MSDRRRVPGGGAPASGSAGPPVLRGLAWGLLAVGSLMVGLLLTGCGAKEPTEVRANSVDGGPELSVLPPCAQIGEGFTVIATDLEPGEEYLVMIDPPHSDDLDDGALGAADQDGKLEIPASLPDDAEIRPGDYTLRVSPFDGDEQLATTELQIAESCPEP